MSQAWVKVDGKLKAPMLLDSVVLCMCSATGVQEGVFRGYMHVCLAVQSLLEVRMRAAGVPPNADGVVEFPVDELVAQCGLVDH